MAETIEDAANKLHALAQEIRNGGGLAGVAAAMSEQASEDLHVIRPGLSLDVKKRA